MAEDYTLYGDPQAIARRRALAEAMMNGALNPVMPERMGNMASVGSPLSALASGLEGYLSAKMSSKADADEKAMKTAYKTAMDDYANKGFAAMQGTPEQRIPAEVGVRPTNDPMPALMGEQPQPVSGVLQSSAGAPKPADYASQLIGGLQPTITKPAQTIPGTAPDMTTAAQYFAKNPDTAALAQKLMEKQAETIAQQNAPVDVSKYLPYMTGQGAAGAMPVGGLTNSGLGAFLQKGFAGGGMPKIEGDRAIDLGTGQMTNLPMTANQQATTDYNNSQTSYNWAKLIADQKQNAIENYLKGQGLNNQQVQLQLDRMKLDPNYQAQVAAAVDIAKAKADREGMKSTAASNGVDLLPMMDQAYDLAGKGQNGGLDRAIGAVGAFFGVGSSDRNADMSLKSLSDRIAALGQKFGPGVQTDADYQRVASAQGVIDSFNSTIADKQAALADAKQATIRLIQKYGSPDDKQALQMYLTKPTPTANLSPQDAALVNQYAPRGK